MPDPQVGTPEWWRDRLGKKMDARDSTLRTFDEYYSGKHRLAFSSAKFKKAFGEQLNKFSDNWCGLVVDAPAERLKPQGFRLSGAKENGQDKLEELSTGDAEAWDIWQRNNLDAETGTGFTEALINGEASMLIWADANGFPQITVEHPRQMYVELVSGSRRQRAAALKRWQDDYGYINATLYTPTYIYKWISAKPSDPVTPYNAQQIQWKKRQPDNETWPLENTLGVVPVVPLFNDPRLLVRGTSEIAQVIPLQDAVNKLFSDMLVASEYAAFKQRWVTGIEIPVDPKTNKPVEPFDYSVARMLMSEDENTRFGEFSATDLDNYVKAMEKAVRDIAVITRTPPHYFFLSGQFPSGESQKAAEAGLVAKVQRKMRYFGESLEETIRLGFLVKGDKAKANAASSEVIWGNPESRSDAVVTNAAVQMAAIGVPWDFILEYLGFSPQQIGRMKELNVLNRPTPADALAMTNPEPPNGQVQEVRSA